MEILPTATEMTNALNQMANPNSASKRVANDWFERGELPPVGAECEYIIGERRGYKSCTFVGLNSRGSIVIEDCNGEYRSYHSHQIKFRPIRTDRDNLIERAERDIESQASLVASTPQIEALIDAGWRPIKQQSEAEFVGSAQDAVDFISFTRETLKKLYRAGCRFINNGE